MVASASPSLGHPADSSTARPVGSPPAASPARRQDHEASPERIAELGATIANRLTENGAEINAINLQTRLLSFNAQIEAARAGAAGASFGVVASEMITLANRTTEVAADLQRETGGAVEELNRISRRLTTEVRGKRLADLALTNIDLIDRNLYERSCDVRWWATDAAIVDALARPSPETAAYAASRLGVILRAYTVYFDIVLVDASGVVVANGRPETYASQGSRHANAAWFTASHRAVSGDDFGFEGPMRTPLAGGASTLMYSCRVAQNGESNGRGLGVLGIVFRWDALAETIVKATPVDAADKPFTRACIVAPDGRVLADSTGRALTDTLRLPNQARILAEPKGFHELDINGVPHLVGHAKAPGFETYTTGWHALVIQRRRDAR